MSVALQGLLVGDVVVEFGSVTRGSFKSLQDIGTVVQHSQGVREGSGGRRDTAKVE